MTSSAPRTLADQLRSWSDEQLTELLTRRPDLANPTPQDTAHLASRASTRASVLRALDGLTQLELVTLDAFVVIGGQEPRRPVHEIVNATRARVDHAVGELRSLALVWGAEDDLRVVSAAADSLGTTVSGLGPPVDQLLGPAGPDRVAGLLADLGGRSSGDRDKDLRLVAELLADPDGVARLVEGSSPAARAMLEHLHATGSAGATDAAAAPVRSDKARSPVEELLSRGLLMPRDRQHVIVPREVAMAMRGGRTTVEEITEPPSLPTSARAVALVDRAGAGAAYELVHSTEVLLEHWAEEPPTVLRQGGVGVRDLRRAAELLHSDESTAALVIETAAAAGLLAPGSTEDLDAAWLPTNAYEPWRVGKVEQRWLRLATAWLENPRLTGRVGGRLNGKTVNALSPELERSWLTDTRFTVLVEIGTLAEGQSLTADGPAALVDRLTWLRPRRTSERANAVLWALEEASKLGLVALGALTRPGRAVTVGDDPARALAPLLPTPVDHVLLQADLTAVAPGPLEDAVGRDLALLAQVESRGGATVYRFTESSVRKAFDAGWSAVEVHAAIDRVARNEVPQPLSYLVDDVARTFGTVRVGAAGSFVRSDDEAALATLLHDPACAPAGLRRLAPTVLISDLPVDLMLARLREAGAAPVVEGPDGVVRFAGREPRRAASPRQGGGRDRVQTEVRTAARAAASVTAIRSGDDAAAVRPAGAPVRQSPAFALALLREASDAARPVWIGYVDNDGTTQDRIVEPQRVEGGWLRAFDQRSQEIRSYAVHRINSVRPV